MLCFPLERNVSFASPTPFPTVFLKDCLVGGDKGKEAQTSLLLASPSVLFFVTSSCVSKGDVLLLHSSLPEVPTVFKLSSGPIFMEDYQIFCNMYHIPEKRPYACVKYQPTVQ